jgi:HK97 family phage prohead protease
MAVSDVKERAAGAVCVRSFEFESRAVGDGRTLEGYAAVFDSPTRIRDLSGDFDETIAHGAFARSLRTRKPVLQFDHGKDPRVGGAPIGDVLELTEDTRGLHVKARLYDHPDVERVRLAIAGGSIRGMSFRFQIPEGGDRWSKRDGDVDMRTVADADVYEIGPVVFPAYDTTSVSVRSLLAQLDPEGHRSLVRELAAELRGYLDTAVDLDGNDFGEQDSARSAPDDENGEPSGSDATPQPHYRQRLDEGALRIRGILK